MIPILSAAQIREADLATMANEPIASIDLMERAAQGCADWLRQRFPLASRTEFLVLCGAGNNGGDGLAIARLLHRDGYTARVVLAAAGKTLSIDAALNLKRVHAMGVPVVVMEVGSDLPPIADREVVVDALFGTGVDRPITGWHKDLIQQLNRSQGLVVAVDMPSGLFCEDNSANDLNAIVRADDTLTFELPKLAMMFAENQQFVGQVHVLPIGLDKDLIQKARSDHFLLTEADAGQALPPRPVFAHKGTFGHALLLAGSREKMGAAMLSTLGAARSGVGLLTAHVPEGTATPFRSRIPEAMLSMDRSPDHLQELPKLDGFSAIGIGPGIGTEEATGRVLKHLLQDAGVPLVLDADALNLLSDNKTWLSFLPPASILTPHPKEFDGLAGKSTSGHERMLKAREFALRFQVVLILKGARTAICTPDGKVYFNPTGNAGMAKGGSGDALTGILTGLCAQGIDPVQAAILGVYAHGLAGDMAAHDLGMDGMIVSDLVDRLPLAWKQLRAAG